MTRDPSRDRPDDGRLVDPALDAAWRGHSREAPSRDLDAAILAAAHRAAGAAPRDAALAEAREPERWWWPLAAAAAIGAIAFGVIQVLPPERDPASDVVTDAPRARNAAPASQPRDAQPAPATAGEPPAAPAPQAATTSRSAESRETAAASPPPQRAQAKPNAEPLAADAARALAPEPNAALSRERIDVRAQPEAPPKVSAFVNRTAPAPIAPSVAPPASAPTAPVPTPASPPPPMPAAAPAPSPPPPPPAPPVETAQPSSAPPAPPTPSAESTTPRAFPAAGVLEKAAVGAAAQRPAARLDASRDRSQAPGDAKQETSAAVPTNPAHWIERIRTLRRDGREQEAQAALREFRAAYADADARLPEELRAWAATVKR